MSSPTALSRIPVLRILLPFALGILIHRLWHCWWAPLVLVALSVIGYLLLTSLSKSPHGRLRFRPYFIIFISTCALALGWLCAVIHCPPQLSATQRLNKNLIGRVAELDYTDFSMRLSIDVLNQDMPPCRVLVSTRGCDYTMQAGDLVTWQGNLTEVGNMGNPGEMDYVNYLLDSKGIRYQQHLPVRELKRASHSPTLMTRLANIRRHLQLQVYNSQVSPAVQQFVVALLLGDSSAIDKTTRQEFSTAGVAHVLALSGLHIGFLALIIWWLLFPLDYLGWKKLRLVITLGVMALFAVFTGLSPSVVRSTLMIGTVFASIIFYRRSVSLNALALAALAILVFSPSAIYSIGFQLSFITVAAVLMFARLPERLRSSHRWVNYLSSTVITSIVAMLATVALCAHYFHTVSLMSVLTNLLVLPILPFFLVLGALFLLATSAGLQWPILDQALEGIYRYIHWAVSMVNGLPLSHVRGVYVTTFGVIAYFVVLALVVLWLYRRKGRYLLWAGCALALLLCHSLWIDYRTPRQGLVIFNSYSSTPLLYFENGTGYVWNPDAEETDSVFFVRYYDGFLARHNINHLHFITDHDSLQLAGAMIRPPVAHLMGRRLLVVGSGRWKQAATVRRLELDDIIVTKRFRGTVPKLQELYDFDRLVLSGAIHDKGPLLNSCDSLGIHLHDLSSAGALVIASH